MAGEHVDRVDRGGGHENSSAAAGHSGADAVVDVLRQAIVHGELPPGQRLITAELAERFDTTRAAVRRALEKLQGEGLIASERNRGAWVREVSLTEAIEITEVRASLEAICAARTALRATQEERRRLRAHSEGMLEAVDAGDVWRYNALSHEFHQLIRDVSHQYTATSIIEKLRFQSARYRFSVSLFPGRAAAGARDHAELIEAIDHRAADRTAHLMQEHILSLAAALKEVSAHTASPDVTRKLGPLMTGGSTWMR